MARDPFGGCSNLPPGCTQEEIDRYFSGPDPSELEEAVLTLLEAAGIPTADCDAIAAIIRAAEIELDQPDPDAQREEDRDRERDQDEIPDHENLWGEDEI